MIKKVFFTACLALLSCISNAQDDDVLTVSELEVGFDTSEDLPSGINAGIIGNLLVTGNNDINDPTSPFIPQIRNDYMEKFSLIVLKGILMGDLGIGNRSLYSGGTGSLPDYVFEPDYDLPSLEDTKTYVEKYKHLPDIIGQAELKEQGHYSVNDMLLGQLKNLEELVLHTIDQEKQINKETAEIDELKTLITALENRLDQLDPK